MWDNNNENKHNKKNNKNNVCSSKPIVQPGSEGGSNSLHTAAVAADILDTAADTVAQTGHFVAAVAPRLFPLAPSPVVHLEEQEELQVDELVGDVGDDSVDNPSHVWLAERSGCC